MIKLTRSTSPVQLTASEVIRLTDIFKAKGDRVWGEKYITDALLKMSDNKCSYCECKIDEESKYLEVEHFKHKDLFPDHVVDWDNLLPSCKHCNVQKGQHNTVIEPIINPFDVDPKKYLTLKSYRMYSRDKNSLGTSTIITVDLNNRARLVNVRAQIGYYIHEELEKLLEVKDEYLTLTPGNKMTRRRRTLINTITNLLLECQPRSEYSATAATELVKDLNYIEIKQMMISENLWSNEINLMHNVAASIELS